MIISFSEVSTKQFDLCVIGSGPAGVICALEYARLNPEKNVLLLEYGYRKQKKNSLDDSISILNPLNHHDPYECTNKGLGGSSGTWGGRCVMYDEIDFLERDVITGQCTWEPALFEEIQHYLPTAAEYFECGKPLFDLEKDPIHKGSRMAENFQPGSVTDSVIERWSMPTRFGQRYSADLEQAKNIYLLEGVEARDFKKDGQGRSICSLTVRQQGIDNPASIHADQFVIAAGAQESTRILLRNKQIIGSHSEGMAHLGRYYQGHVSGKIASVQFYGDPSKTDHGFLRDTDGTYVRRRFQFTKEALLENNLLNTTIWLDNPLYYDPGHRSGAMSFMYLMMIMPIMGKKLAPPAIAHSITKGKRIGIYAHLKNILRDFPGSLAIPFSIFWRRYLLKRKLPGVFIYSSENRYALHFHAEQVPDPENRIELNRDGETLVVHYKLTETDVDSVIRCHEILDQWLRDCRCGELDYWYEREDLHRAIRENSKDGIHQVGTTRIAKSEEEGVVDHNLRVFGTDNLFVCSSSTFPTSGQANPTFLLGAFAVRLAEHLSGNA